MTAAVDGAEWMDRAACVGADPELFFPARGKTDDVAVAKAICRSCPVSTDCLEHALVNGERHGVWGGKSERERRRLRAGRLRVVR